MLALIHVVSPFQRWYAGTNASRAQKGKQCVAMLASNFISLEISISHDNGKHWSTMSYVYPSSIKSKLHKKA